MVSLREACIIALAKHPKEYIFGVNEDNQVYECLMLNIGESPEGNLGILPAIVIRKSDGVTEDDLFAGEYDMAENFRYHNTREIANLLREEKRGA